MATYILIGDEKVKVRLSEKASRSERELTVEEITFEIDEYVDSFQKRWVDKVQRPLEEQLNEVIAGRILASETLPLRCPLYPS